MKSCPPPHGASLWEGTKLQTAKKIKETVPLFPLLISQRPFWEMPNKFRDIYFRASHQSTFYLGNTIVFYLSYLYNFTRSKIYLQPHSFSFI